MRILSFLNDGTIPDLRGNAPALVAQNLLRYCPNIESYAFVDEETHPQGIVYDPLYGTIFRESAGKTYRRFFQKITRLDPWPRWKRAAYFANREKIELVHAHQLEFPVDAFRRSLKNQQTPIAVHMHVKRTYNKALGTADCYFAVSEYTRRLLTEKHGYPKDLTEVIYNGVDTEAFHPATEETRSLIKQSMGIPEDSIVLSYVGRKISSKGYLAFLETAQELLPSFNNLYVIAAGMTPSGSQHDPFYDRISKLKNSLAPCSRYIDLDALPQMELTKIFQCTDVLQFSTYFGDETFGMVAVEGMASGCVVIASKYSALPEIITDQFDGFLVDEPRDIPSVVAKTESVIARLSDFQELRRNARNCAVQKFDWKISAQKLGNVYERLILVSQ